MTAYGNVLAGDDHAQMIQRCATAATQLLTYRALFHVRLSEEISSERLRDLLPLPPTGERLRRRWRVPDSKRRRFLYMSTLHAPPCVSATPHANKTYFPTPMRANSQAEAHAQD